MRKNSYCFFLALLCFAIEVEAQDSSSSDTSRGDSLKIYRKIEKFSKKHKVTSLLYDATFNLPGETRKDTVLRKQYLNAVYEGKIVRHIVVRTTDPFGYNVRDTSVMPRNFIQRSGNFLHKRSAALTIKNQLLIKRDKPLDVLLLKESERLLRQSAYVMDVVIDVIPVPGTDSVDVLIREQDLWSIGAGIGVSGTKQTIFARDKNFLGLSHQLEGWFYYFNEEKKYLFQGSYTIPYLLNTYITTTALFSTSKELYVNGVSINRTFYSSLTKWAGGIDYLFHGSTDSLRFAEALSQAYHIHFRDLDVWAGRSFPVAIGKSDKARSTRLITTLRILDRKYSEIPPITADSMHLYSSSKFYLGSVGITTRTYYRDTYIYRYGIPEDIPSGRMAQVLFGYEDGINTGRIYAGAQAGYGDHFKNFGYLSTFLGYGTFLRNGQAEQSVINTTLGYFSDMLHVGTWGYRQFVKSQLVYGLSRKPGEAININNDNGIKGFNSESLKGTNKIVMTLQSQLYLPYNLIGFHFAPFLFCHFGMLGDDETPFQKGRLFQGYGLGLLVKNELLAINTFQISFGFYPFIPDVGNSIPKFNPLKTYNFTFRDFDVEKPAPVLFE
ncbi:MAG: hypothetical protein ABI763_03745 [Bacteroidota bacterium]